MCPEPRLIEVRKNVLKQNDVVARALRDRFRASGVFVVSLVSSPGSGKTAFLEKTLTQLRPNYRVAALVGDLATENDALRLARSQVPVKQITTGTLCHLEAAMVQSALEEWDLNQLDFLFIDGDHSYEGVRSDFEMYAPLVRSGGLIAFHDITPSKGSRHVYRFWDEIKVSYTHKEFIHRTGEGAMGIGVLWI